MSKQPFLLAVVFLCLAAPSVLAQNSADLNVTKDGPSTLVSDTDVTYTIVLSNLGPDNASSVQLTDPIPPGMTFVSINQPGGFLCSTPQAGSGGTVTCSIDPMTAGSSVTFTLVVHLDPNTADGTFFTNIATASSPDDPNDENNQGVSTGSTSPPPSADMSVNKSGPESAAPGSDVTYTINVFNGGPDAASTVTVTDTLPGDMTFVSLTGTTGFNCTTPSIGAGGTITCTIASYPANTGQLFTLVGHIPPAKPAGTEYTNTATVTSSNDESTDNNSSTVTTIVSAADMSISKTAPSTADAGTNAAYVITITNNGPDFAASAGFTDPLPAGTTFVSVAQNSGSPSGCNAPPPGSGGTVGCSLFANLPNGFSAQFTVTVKIGSSVAAGSSVSNTATTTSDTADPNGANNGATASTTVTAQADVAVTKSAPPTTAPNTDVPFTIGASNSGPSDAQSITVSDTTPANTTFVSMTAPGYSCTTPAVGGTGAISCTRPTLAAGVNTTLTLVVHTTSSAVGPITNTVTIASTTTDPNPSNNTATVTSSSIATDLGITKTAPQTAVASANITYTITATNNGPNPAASVVVSDVMPANTTFVSISTPAGFNCTTPAAGGNGTITCNAPTFANPATATFTLVLGTSPAGAGTTVTNTATISSATADFNSANNSSTANTTLTGSADLAVTKTATAAPDISKVAYNVTVTNNGPSDATTVTMSDATPAGTTFVSNTQTSGPAFACTNPAAGGTGTITCTIGTLAAGASANFKLIFQPTNSSSPTTNTATVSSPTLDPNPANNSSSGAATPANGIPAVSPLGLAALALALATIAGVVLRR